MEFRGRSSNKIRFQQDSRKQIPNQTSPETNKNNQEKGLEFEKFVVQRFDQDYFTLVEWRSDKNVGGIFPLMSKFPDLEFYYESKTDFFQFAVECKWREHFYRDCVEIDKYQIENYQHYEKVTGYRTFLVIGIGNVPISPMHLYIIPLSEIKNNKMHEFEMEVYRRKNPLESFFLDCKHQRLI